MFTRVLSEPEKKRIQKFLKTDGEKKSDVRALATRCRKYVPQIKRDLELIERFMATYEGSAKRD